MTAPASRHPEPPFPEQQQSWPALACRMRPPPDHGEASYVGSGRLAGRKAPITGGDSGIRANAVAAGPCWTPLQLAGGETGP